MHFCAGLDGTIDQPRLSIYLYDVFWVEADKIRISQSGVAAEEKSVPDFTILWSEFVDRNVF